MGPRFRGDDQSRARRQTVFGNSQSHDVKQPISFPRRVCVRGLQFCFAHPNRGVGGAPRDVRVLGGTPVGRIMTRYARRLRGALRPMTRRTAGGNNATISMARGGSVPIVSQTEIYPMKTALSLILACVSWAIPSPARLIDGHPARSYAWSINRTTRAQSCTLIGGAAPRRQWSSASRSAVKAGAVTLAPGRVSSLSAVASFMIPSFIVRI